MPTTFDDRVKASKQIDIWQARRKFTEDTIIRERDMIAKLANMLNLSVDVVQKIWEAI